MNAGDGSSPPTRGTRTGGRLRPGESRFIPAHAGNTKAFLFRGINHSVHPRPRGEHASTATRYSLSSGSSPPTRGTHHALRCGGDGVRFIPAHAGNTRASSVGSPPLTVHPRPRGEHTLSMGWSIVTGGSSPPTRGTRNVVQIFLRNARFIPAHAGNTYSGSASPILFAVHPRPRGEHYRHERHPEQATGSSPPTRGTPQHSGPSPFALRFIPAHAGNTSSAPSWSRIRTVHPRPRGEHDRIGEDVSDR